MIVQNGVTLESTIGLGPDRLMLVYVVRNGSGREIGLFNRIPLLSPEGKASFPPDHVYIDIEETTLHFKKMILPVPEGLRMAFRPVPAVMRVEHGAVFQEEVKVALPAVANNPLRRAKMVGEAGGRPVVADVLRRGDAARFSLGFFFVEPGMRLDATGTPEVFQVYPPPIDGQLLLSEALVMPAPVAALDYRVVMPGDTEERKK
jgi:hypothetical protein